MSKLIEVTFIKSHPKYAYFAGNAGMISARKVFRMVLDGYVSIRATSVLKWILSSVISPFKKWSKTIN